MFNVGTGGVDGGLQKVQEACDNAETNIVQIISLGHPRERNAYL